MEDNQSRVTVLYASQSGNAEDLAAQAVQDLKKSGLEAESFNMMDYSIAQLEDDTSLLIIASTWGDGEPPDEAEEFYNTLLEAPAMKLPNLKYAIMALGDSYYEAFCQFGKNLDSVLDLYGAVRLRPRLDCDMDHEEQYPDWIEDVKTLLATNPQAEVA